MSELNLLIECINTEGEAEDGGIKYIYMDADTIYRFENNRMKKISKTLINKAKKQIQLQNVIPKESVDNDVDDAKPVKKVKKTKKANKVPPLDDEYDDEEEEQVEVIKPKKSKLKQTKPKRNLDFSPNINLDEYYNNKNKMEYMNLEITRLNNKVDKLKQYKAIVNKLTGNEFDFEVPNSQCSNNNVQQQQSIQQGRNDSLFLY